MEDSEIVSGNKLIAEFMGGKLCNGGFINSPSEMDSYKFKGEIYTFYQLKYNTSWDWLMPVLEKIKPKDNEMKLSNAMIHLRIWQNGCKIDYNFRTSDVDPNNACDTILVKNEPTFILAVWKSVVEFIQWYNKQKK